MNSNSDKYEKFIKFIKISDFTSTKSHFDVKYFKMEDKYGLKPIHWACLSCNIDILEWMLQKKCDIETSSRNGWRPIHFASFIGNDEMVTFLIRQNCRMDCKTDNEETVLVVANGDCNHEFIDEILNENINLKIGLSIGLKCGKFCDHKICLKFFTQPKYLNAWTHKRGKIFPITYSSSNRKFVYKLIDRSEYNEYEDERFVLPKINEILPNLNHPKFVNYYGLIQTESRMILFAEWMNRGTLKKKKNIKTLNKILRYCKDILQAIAFLHDNKILHRFIYPQNIYMDNNGGCKLAISLYSYSLAGGDVQIDDEWWEKNKKYSFPAPELVKDGILSYPYDIFFLGCTVIEMSTGNHIHYKSIKFDEIERITTEISNEELQSFIRSMVMENPTKRATAKDLLNHELMRNNNYLSIFDNYLIDRNKTINIIHNKIH